MNLFRKTWITLKAMDENKQSGWMMSHFWMQTKIDWLMKFTRMMWFYKNFRPCCCCCRWHFVLRFFGRWRKNNINFIIKQSDLVTHTVGVCYILLCQHCTGMFEHVLSLHFNMITIKLTYATELSKHSLQPKNVPYKIM